MRIGITCYPTTAAPDLASGARMELAARGHESFHQLRPPIRMNPKTFASFSRSGSRFLTRSSTIRLHAGACHIMLEVFESETLTFARPLRQPHSVSARARTLHGRPAPPSLHHHASRTESLSSAATAAIFHHQVFHRAERRCHLHLALSSEGDSQDFDIKRPSRSSPIRKFAISTIAQRQRAPRAMGFPAASPFSCTFRFPR